MVTPFPVAVGLPSIRVPITANMIQNEIWYQFFESLYERSGGDTDSFAIVYNYIDAQDAATLASANAHADAGDIATLAAAELYSDAGDAATLAAAEAYTDAAIGTSGDFSGPGSSVTDDFVTFADNTGKTGKDSGLKADTDGALSANSDSRIATQKATKTYADAVGATAVTTSNAYTDTVVNGRSWKDAVRAATTANGTLATAFANGQVLDGVTLATGNRILLKNQSTASENGLYNVAAIGAPTRTTDADTGSELVDASCYVSEGTVNADLQFTCTTNAPIVLGVTNLTFVQSGAGSTYTADGVTLQLVGNQFSVKAGGISNTEIASDAVTFDKFVNSSAQYKIVARKSSGAGDFEECTLSELLDFVTSAAQGDILFRGASLWQRLAASTAGYLLQTGGAGANPSWVAPGTGGIGALTLISTIVTSGSQVNVDFSSIAAIYSYLELYVDGRLLNSTPDNDVKLQFNSDTGNNYDYLNKYAASSAGVSEDSASATSAITVGHLPAATANTNYEGSVFVRIPRYASTTSWKRTGSESDGDTSGTGTGAGTIRWMKSTGTWRNTAAITDIRVIGGSGFRNGSVLSLYGRTG